MPALSPRFTESIKTGLSMVIAIAIALRLDFEEPEWAGFAVAMISLDTAGQSLNKAALRMFGTLVAFVASLTFIGLYPQERWAMMLALTPYIGFCTYMLTGKKRQYFWYVCAFVCLTIMLHGGMESENAFRFAVARVEETAMGILVYALISVFLWPRTSHGDLEATAGAIFDIQLRVYRAYRGLLTGPGSTEDYRPLRLPWAQQLSHLGQVFKAAMADTYRVWELRHAWRRVHQQSSILMEVFGRWRTCIPEVRRLDLARMLPGVEASLSEFDRRFAQMKRMLAGQGAEGTPRTVELEIDESAVRALSHFDRAALALFQTQLRKLDEVSRALFGSVAEIQGSGQIASEPLRGDALPASPVIDVDRLRAVVTVLAVMWTGFVLWVWVDPPGDANFWYQATLWSMIALMGGQTPQSMLPGFLLGIAVGGVAYIGVMPHLSGYGGLGLMLFCAIAGGFYLLWDPRHRGTRTMYAALFLIITSIENEQTYSFATYANTSAAALLSLALASAMAYFPGSPRPEKVFLRLLARFFRRGAFLMSRLAPDRDRNRSLIDRWRVALYRNDLLELPVKLEAWSERIDCRLLPGTKPEQVRDLVMNLFDIALRTRELCDAREHVQPDPRLEEVVDDLRAWRVVAQQQFALWALDPSAALDPDADMSERLTARLARMEASLDAARAGHDGFGLDYEAIYRYLGGFRGLSEATIGYAKLADSVNWPVWREARF